MATYNYSYVFNLQSAFCNSISTDCSVLVSLKHFDQIIMYIYIWGCVKSIQRIPTLSSSSSVFWICRYFLMRGTWNKIQLEIFPDTHLPFIRDTAKRTTKPTTGTTERTSVRSQSHSHSLRVQLNCRKKTLSASWMPDKIVKMSFERN